MRESSGTLLYRDGTGGMEVLLVHPSGAYNRNKPWSIPKGEPDENEEPEAAARRETMEETGVTAGELFALGHIDYTKSRKRIHCFGGPAPAEAVPVCASWEVDQACFLPLTKAKDVVHPEQRVFMERLEEYLKK